MRNTVPILVRMHNDSACPSCFSCACMMIFSKPKKILMLAIVMKEEKTPHSPNAEGVYRRVKIGVTMMGSRYMMILLTDILAVSLNNAEFNMFVNRVVKMYIC